MKRIFLILVLAALVLSTLAVYAFEPTTLAENDPLINPDANACFVGGSMVGKCDSDLLWNIGWYLIRFEKGIITEGQVPDQYKWALPKETAPDIVVPTPTKTPPK